MYLLHKAIQVKFDFRRYGWDLTEKLGHSYLIALEDVAEKAKNPE